MIAPWPVERPKDWRRRVNTPLSPKELRRLRMSLERGQPYGEEEWVQRTAQELGLEHTMRPEGRPPKRSDAGGGAKN
jgi:putative transposase